MADSLQQLREEVVVCRTCPRLVVHRERVAREKKKQFRNDTYWGRPVPGFGDPDARLVVVGLAPAAHGSNRTGRVFTGDRSAEFLVGALHAAGFASQPHSTRRGDGLRYQDAYLTAAVRCVPPDNRPTPAEKAACLPYLSRELRLLTRARSLLALGGFAWDALRDSIPELYSLPRPSVEFAHGRCVPLGPGRPMLWGSYHPSPQNTNTGKLDRRMFVELLDNIRASWSGDPSGPTARQG
ncbi:MAG: uracil-DNA glycosylase [Thermoplasmata archaeon]|nr:uracil-DNA glycosylase [Thermoplasmata archaeon]